MKVKFFTDQLKQFGIETLVGVPDSTLRPFCDYISTDGQNQFRHYVAANEGGAIGIAAGVYLSTGKPACVYMQNSGIGNAVNPLTSIMNKDVYGIPALLLIGWRGEPGVHDEPQHIFMGKITTDILKLLDIPYTIIDGKTNEEQLQTALGEAAKAIENKKQYALIIKKNTFEAEFEVKHTNSNSLCRENVIREILRIIGKDDVIVSTTGKISREVYEQSNAIWNQHSQDFLTVGGMGHAAMIAFGVAENMPHKRVFCLDGDGAVLMHMGNLPVIGKNAPSNFIHICLNNEAHESVGGIPTGAAGQSYAGLALKSGYKNSFCINDEAELHQILSQLSSMKGPAFLEILVSMDSRSDLGRPKESAAENKEAFMKYHRGK